MSTVLNTAFGAYTGASGLVLPPHLLPPTRSAALSSLAFDLLFYDKVLLLLNDFGNLIEFSKWLGEAHFRTLLDQDSLKLAWLDSHIAYAPRGSFLQAGPGIVNMQILSDTRERLTLEEHFNRAASRVSNWGRRRRQSFFSLLEPATLYVPEEVFIEAKTGTQGDMQEPAIRAAFQLREESLVRDEGDPEIHRLLRLHTLNLSIASAVALETTELHVESSLEHVLPIKLGKITRPAQLGQQLVETMELAELPDPRLFAASGDRFAGLVEFRDSVPAQRFREWLQTKVPDPTDGHELLQEYIHSLRAKDDYRPRPVRALVSKGAGVVASLILALSMDPVAGLLVPPFIEEAAGRAVDHVQQAFFKGWRFDSFLDDDLSAILDSAQD